MSPLGQKPLPQGASDLPLTQAHSDQAWGTHREGRTRHGPRLLHALRPSQCLAVEATREWRTARPLTLPPRDDGFLGFLGSHCLHSVTAWAWLRAGERRGGCPHRAAAALLSTLAAAEIQEHNLRDSWKLLEVLPGSAADRSCSPSSDTSRLPLTRPLPGEAGGWMLRLVMTAVRQNPRSRCLTSSGCAAWGRPQQSSRAHVLLH